MRRAVEQPGEGEGGGRVAPVPCEGMEGIEFRAVVRPVLRVKTRDAGAEFLRREQCGVGHRGAEGAAGEGGEWDESDAQAGAALDQAKFRGAGPEGVFVLHGHHGVDGVAAFQGVGADFAEAVAEDFALFDKALHSARQIFGRNLRVVAMGVEEGDMVDAQPFQRAFQFRAQVVGAVVDATSGVVREGGLGGDTGAVAAGLEPLADHRLADALTIAVGGVEEGDAVIPCGVEGAQGFGLGRRAEHAAEGQAAEAEGRDRGAVPAEVPLPHRRLLPFGGRRRDRAAMVKR